MLFPYSPSLTNTPKRQLSEIPCFCLFLLGITMWFNFSRVGGDTMYLYYPVILIGLTTIFLFAPIPLFYHKTRRWFLYNCVRISISNIWMYLLISTSGAYSSLEHIRSSSETSSSAICSAVRHTRLAIWSCSSAYTLIIG